MLTKVNAMIRGENYRRISIRPNNPIRSSKQKGLILPLITFYRDSLLGDF